MQRFTKADIHAIQSKRLYEGYTQLDQYTIDIRYFNGDSSGAFVRECVRKKPVAGVLPYDVHADTVLFVEQFRIGALQDACSPWLMEMVAGVVDHPDEDVQHVAHRELQEETGLVAHHLTCIHRYWVSPGASDEYVSLFLALVDQSDAQTFCGLKSEHEDIKVHKIPYNDAISWLKKGSINNSLTIIALQWLALHRDELRERYS